MRIYDLRSFWLLRGVANLLICAPQRWRDKVQQLQHAGTLSQMTAIEVPTLEKDAALLQKTTGETMNKNMDSEELNSDDDDIEEECDAETKNLILCQYQKVSRNKNKWKVQLESGVC